MELIRDLQRDVQVTSTEYKPVEVTSTQNMKTYVVEFTEKDMERLAYLVGYLDGRTTEGKCARHILWDLQKLCGIRPHTKKLGKY